MVVMKPLSYSMQSIQRLITLPVDKERRTWSAEALQRKEAEVAEAEAYYKDEVSAACSHLIERFAI